MENKALNPSGMGKIDVALRAENVTCARCLSALEQKSLSAAKASEK